MSCKRIASTPHLCRTFDDILYGLEIVFRGRTEAEAIFDLIFEVDI
ncbi:MAG: hypothetical protein OXI61_03255 [Candidatus Poribacteria bacterium]|nr:hypothetical protein [Candidatus Poribacteria bacterium]